MSTTYAFRDTGVAADRLALLADVFDPTTWSFLDEDGARGVDLALDLGCGAGQTTRLLAKLDPLRLVGLDSSRAFVERTRRQGFEAVEHDVTVTPFPTGPADLLFCRFLLTHLAEPASVVERWMRELRPCGLLLVEEVESIETADPVFARYLATVDALLQRRGGRLAVGSLLPPATRSRIVTVEPDSARVARMFALNLEAWRDEIAPQLADELAAGLADPDHEPIVWRLRQAVYRRDA
jgi:trans-aconitate methyltransferase